MWPWGHLAVGYLLYSLGLRQRGRLPQYPEVFLVTFGALFSDLVDKPLAWSLGLLDSGRSLGHSVLIAVLVIAFLYAFVAPTIGRSKVTAFAVGYLSHPVADLPFRDLLVGDLEFTTYLLWPVLPAPPYDEAGRTVIGYLLSYQPVPADAVQFVLFGLAIVLWHYDGRPGLDELRRSVRLDTDSSTPE